MEKFASEDRRGMIDSNGEHQQNRRDGGVASWFSKVQQQLDEA